MAGGDHDDDVFALGVLCCFHWFILTVYFIKYPQSRSTFKSSTCLGISIEKRLQECFLLLLVFEVHLSVQNSDIHVEEWVYIWTTTN